MLNGKRPSRQIKRYLYEKGREQPELLVAAVQTADASRLNTQFHQATHRMEGGA